MPRLAERPQHERIKSTLKDSRLRGHPIRDCNYSLDIKGFAKNHKTASPFLGHHKQLSRESHEKASTPTPGSVSLNFSSHVSHKQITVKKRRLSGCIDLQT